MAPTNIMQAFPDGDPAYSETVAAEYIGMAPGTLTQWRFHRIGPRYVKISRGRVVYRRSALDAFLAAREVETQVNGRRPPQEKRQAVTA